jgi:hypothetical protein
MDLMKKKTLSEKRAAYEKKLSDNYEINVLFTNFEKEIQKAKLKLDRNSALQDYFHRNQLFNLQKILEKEEKFLNHWLQKLLKGQKEYYKLL